MQTPGDGPFGRRHAQITKKYYKRNAFFVPEHENTEHVMFFCPQARKHSKRNAFFAPEHENTENVMLFLSPSTNTQ